TSTKIADQTRCQPWSLSAREARNISRLTAFSSNIILDRILVSSIDYFNVKETLIEGAPAQCCSRNRTLFEGTMQPGRWFRYKRTWRRARGFDTRRQRTVVTTCSRAARLSQFKESPVPADGVTCGL